MTLDKHIVTSASGEYTRDVWLIPSPVGEPTRLCVFLDAEFYLERMDAAATITSMIERGEISPVACVFVSHNGREARHYDYTCSSRYSEFVAGDIVAFAMSQFPTLASGGHVACGLSLSGLASAYLAVTQTRVFSSALCQSPSFWYADEVFAVYSALVRPDGASLWISVGDRETEAGIEHPPTGLWQNVSQLESVERAASILASHGNHVQYRVFEGGHEIEPWRDELPDALRWLLG
ncbi:MAG TPA: alpha/beta hydrolase-fold protein [Capsulimonadaceae bacterium]|jgi:enterochelin esterase family protein